MRLWRIARIAHSFTEAAMFKLEEEKEIFLETEKRLRLRIKNMSEELNIK